ncbi:MAG: M16 family metallopeptidase, partial [Vulcanimicrobiaceae bacterium]
YAHDALGTRPSFDKTTGALLKRFHDRWYAPNNAILVIVGNVDPPATLERVKALFGKIPARPLPPRPKFDFGPVTPKQITLASAYAVPFVVIAYRTPGYDSPDAPALTIAADVLNSERGALFALQADGKALGTGVQLDILPKAGIATAYIATAPGSDTAAAQRLLESTLAAYRRDGVAADLVAAAKRQEIAQAQFTRNSISEVAFDWSQALALEGIGSPSARVARLSAVTTADVKRVIRTYFDDRSAVVGVLVPKGAGAASPSRGFGGQESFAPSKTTAVALPGWAQPLLEQPKIVAPELHPVDQTLANGIRLIVIPTTISPTVLVRGGILHRPDLQEPAGQAGVDGVLDGMFAYGTTDLNRIAFQTALDTIAANESAGSSFSLDVPAGRFDRGMQLLADNLLHPALPAAAFKIVQKQTAQSLAGEATSPGYLAHRALLHALLPPNDAELRQATPQTVGALTEQAVRAYYATVFRPDLTTIVVAGDVTPERARAVVEKWFGDWHATGPKPTVELPPVPSNGPAAVDVPATGRLQASVTLEETLGVKLAGRDYHALELGNSVLGGGFYATRFYRDLREKAGLVYFVGAHIAATKTRATYTVTFGSDPQNVPKARAIIDGDLRSMAQTDATPAELRLAKTTIVRDLALSGASLGAVAGEQLGYALQGLPPDQFIRAVREIVGLDAADVRAAFAKWIDPARFVQVTEGPAPK